MKSNVGFLAPLARTLIAAIFVLSGWSKLMDVSGTAKHIADKGLPLPIVAAVIAVVVELGGGLALIAGIKARWVSLAMFVFMIPTTYFFHDFWHVQGGAQLMQKIQFEKNLAIMGGLLMVFVFGVGPLSVDKK